MAKTVAVHTMGCRLNQADSALICDRLRRDGWNVVETDSAVPLDLVIINTCTVTGTASQKSRQTARRFKKQHPECRVVVTGCSAEIDREVWSRDQAVDLVVPNPAKKRLIELIHQLMAGQGIAARLGLSMDEVPDSVFQEQAEAEFPFKSRAFIKAQEGCNNFCSYCIVPYARGPERSRAWDEVVADFERQLERGFQEIVLTGVNICAYHDGGRRLPELVDRLCSFPGNYRLRLSSTEPHPNNRELIGVMAAHPKVCRFLHLALQHGSDPILKAMNRKYTAAEYVDFAQAARTTIPGIHLGTDLIVGFPGETDALFEESCRLVERMNFANIHLFSFSPRRGTPAATMAGQVPAAVVKERFQYLSELAERSRLAFWQSQLGETLPVVFEKRDEQGVCTGWSDNYISVSCPAPEARLHEIIPVKTDRLTEDGLAGQLIS